MVHQSKAVGRSAVGHDDQDDRGGNGGHQGKSGHDDIGDLIAIAAGHRQALASLYDRYASNLLALGTRMLGGRKDAEDILHDVFVEVWKRAGDYRPSRGSVRTWLFLRMRSRCLDRLRRADYSRTDSLSAQGDESGRPGAEPGCLVVHMGEVASMARLKTALQSLPTTQRQVIELGYFAGMSSSEMARELGIPVGTVKSRLAAGIDKLRASVGVSRKEAS